METPHDLGGRRPTDSVLHLALALAIGLAISTGGCGEDPVVPHPDPLGKGWIAGSAFVAGDVDGERTAQIRIEVFEAGSNVKVSTTFPDENGRFRSDALDPGDYDLTATLDFPGYFPARLENIPVSPGATTELPAQVTVPDTSSIRFADLRPIPFSFNVDRRPFVSGEFRSAGSGFKLHTFVLTIDGRRITTGLEIEEIEPRRYGTFEYQPPANFDPGEIVAQVSMSNWAGQLFAQRWTFHVLEGIARRVPAEYATIEEAVLAANHGDTVLVAAGIHNASDVRIDKDILVLGEMGREATTVRSSGSRHFFMTGDPSRHVILKGLTLEEGQTGEAQPGGSILCRDIRLTLDDCSFVNNASLDRGGALAIFDSPTVIKDCLFAGNSAFRGGAIAIFDGSTPEIHQCIFSRNSVSGALGGAILVEYAQPNIHHNTFFRNDAGSGQGGAIMADFRTGPATVRTERNIFFENHSHPSNGSAIALNGSNLTSICDGFLRNDGLPVSGSTPDIRQLLDLPSDASPGFCDLPGEDLRIDPGSDFLSDGCERGAFPPGCSP